MVEKKTIEGTLKKDKEKVREEVVEDLWHEVTEEVSLCGRRV